MEIIKTKDYSELSNKAAQKVIFQLNKKLNSVICLPTGKTPLKMYKLLIEANKKKKVDFSRAIFFNLDEYFLIDAKSRGSFSYYLFKNFFNKINVKKSNINMLDGNTKNPGRECKNYELKIRKNPIDLLILGVGVNGHVAFNEPGSEAGSRTRVVELTSETKKINKMNKKALTIGIATVMKSKKIVLLASGKKKANAVSYLVKGKSSKRYPVSFLKNHKDLTIIIDKKAGSLVGS